jgi:hypothetical protein
MMKYCYIIFLGLIVNFTLAAEKSVPQRIIPMPPQARAPDSLPSGAEMAKIMRAFVDREPRITLLGGTFQGSNAEIYYENRGNRTVRFDTVITFGDTYYIVLFFRIKLDESLSTVLDYKCLEFGATYLPPAATHVSQAYAFKKFPLDDLESLCKSPSEYLDEQIPKKNGTETESGR